MKLKRKRKTVSVPLFSTSDIAFLLLIFIMLVSLINYREEIAIDFAEARTALRTSAERNLEVWIDTDGVIYLDGILADHRAVEDAISELHVTAPDTRVHIIADRNVTYDKVNSVLEILQLLEYRLVSFVVHAHE